MNKALTGIRILDLSRWLAGPLGATLLSHMGAEVIRVERPKDETERDFGPFTLEGESMLTMSTLQNRLGVTLDISKPKGKEMLYKMVATADVLVHNSVVGSPDHEIIKYDVLKQIKPDIIVAAVSGFGATGPYAQRPCFDTIAQALSGSMSYTGFPEGPPTRSGAPWVDFSAGAHLGLGIMFALYHRLKTGEGQEIDVALLDVAVTATCALSVAPEYQKTGFIRPRQGNRSFHSFTDCYEAKDGWVMLGVTSNPIWRRFCRAIGREDIMDDPRFAKNDEIRYLNAAELSPIVAAWVKERYVDDVVEIFTKARVPCSRVNNIPQMIEDPQVKERQALVPMEYPGLGELLIPGVAIKMSKTPGSIDRRAPKVGENNEEVYGRLLGLTPEDLAALKTEEVI